MAFRTLGHSTLSNMFARSMSATSVGSRVSQGGPPVSVRLTGTWQIDAPLVKFQGDGPKAFVHKANQALGVSRTQKFAILMSLGVPLFLRCQQRPVRVSQRADGGSVREMQRNTLVGMRR